MWLSNRTGQCCHLPNCNEAMNLACCLWINSTVTPSSHYLQKWVNHYAKLIQRLIGLHIESDVLMRGLRHILSSKDMSLADEAYVKSIGTIGENSSSKENGEKAGERGPCGSIWIANQSSRIWGKSSYWRSLITLLELGPSNLDFSIRRLFF